VSRTVLVTGATGFIGAHVAAALAERGYAVRALVRPGSALPAHLGGIEVAAGDVRERAGVAAAVAGCWGVVHVAARYAFWEREPDEPFRTNVEGTRIVLEEAVRAGAERIVHTSTVGTLRFPQGRPATEDDRGGPADMVGPYKRTKWEAERIARRMGAAGAPIVIVQPTAPIGPGDAKPTPTGQVIVDFLRHRLPAYVDTGLNLVHVADVAEGHALALERGQPGGAYLLGQREGNLTLAGLLSMLAQMTGLRAPRVRVPVNLAVAMAHLDGLVEGRVLGREPRIPLEGARMARKHMWADPARAITELGLPERPVAQAVWDAAAWFIDQGHAPAPAAWPAMPRPTGTQAARP
jgi:dihydroflavonol-4-reductase